MLSLINVRTPSPRYSITAVAAVIWNISPNVRCDAMLSGQARLIDMFCTGRVGDYLQYRTLHYNDLP